MPGDHLELVDLDDAGSMSSQVVREGLLGVRGPAGPWNGARLAVESNEYDRVIRELGEHPGELDEQHLIDLALALEATGRREEALALLDRHAGQPRHRRQGYARRTDQAQLARRWPPRDAEAALELYSEALAAALEARRRRADLLPRDQRRLPRARLPPRPAPPRSAPSRRSMPASAPGRATGGWRPRGRPICTSATPTARSRPTAAAVALEPTKRRAAIGLPSGPPPVSCSGAATSATTSKRSSALSGRPAIESRKPAAARIRLASGDSTRSRIRRRVVDPTLGGLGIGDDDLVADRARDAWQELDRGEVLALVVLARASAHGRMQGCVRRRRSCAARAVNSIRPRTCRATSGCAP